MKNLKQKVIVLAVVMAGLIPACLNAQGIENARPVTDARLQNPEPENWLMFRRSYDGWGYSPLAKITRKRRTPTNCMDIATGVTEGHHAAIAEGSCTSPRSQPGYALNCRHGEAYGNTGASCRSTSGLMHPTIAVRPLR